jgi:tripartite-type tricarboxylate transporter receptor subunit TctC
LTTPLLKALLGAAFAVLAAVAPAQTAYPTKTVTLVNPFAAGGPADAVARAVAQKLQDAWHQPVLVESRPGANGAIGIRFVAAAPADGHTLVVMPIGNAAIIPSMEPDIGYDIERDFVPVSLMANVENILAVNPQTPARNLKELLALARAQPGKLTFASPGQGSMPHVGVELLKTREHIYLLHVPYKGVAPALTDVMGGHVTMMLGQASSVLPMVKSGKLTAIGIASARRSPLAPDLPTIAEQGVPGFEAVAWYALMAPAGTPREVVARIATETARALQDNGVRERLTALGIDPVGSTPEQFAQVLRRDRARWSAVVKEQKLKFD